MFIWEVGHGGGKLKFECFISLDKVGEQSLLWWEDWTVKPGDDT